MASVADKFKRASNGGIPVVATVQSLRAPGGTTLSVDTQQFWPDNTQTGVDFSTYKLDTNNVKVPGSQIDWKGVSNGTNSLSGMVQVGGASDTGNAVGDKVQMGPTAQWGDDIATGILVQHSQDGTHNAITATTITATGAISGSAGLSISAGSLTLPNSSIVPSMMGLTKGSADANGWIKRDYGSWQTYERTVAISALSIAGGAQISIVTHSMPVGIADSSLLRFSITQVAGFQGRAFVGYDNNNTAAQTSLSLFAYNALGTTIVFSGLVYITATTV